MLETGFAALKCPTLAYDVVHRPLQIGSSAGGLIHIMFMEHGFDITREFFDNIQKCINNWILIEGHAMSMHLHSIKGDTCHTALSYCLGIRFTDAGDGPMLF